MLRGSRGTEPTKVQSHELGPRTAIGPRCSGDGAEADLIAPRRQLGQHLGHRLAPEQLGPTRFDLMDAAKGPRNSEGRVKFASNRSLLNKER